MAPRRAGTHSELPAPPPPFSRGRMLLLAIVGASILLVVVIVIKFGGKSGGAGDSIAHAGPPSTPEKTASAGAPQGAPKTAKNAAGGLDPVAGQSDADKAFVDPRNKFTVRVAQYANDATGERHARETYKYLRTEGVPAVQPIKSGDDRHIYLCADAQPKKDDLVVLLGYVKRLRGSDRKSMPFADAYVDNIDHLINR
jgi:hypothetical protein